MIKIKTILFLILIVFAFNKADSQTLADKENLKAVFIERFTRFIIWPQNDSSLGKEIKIGVYKDAGFSEVLKKVYSANKIKDKNVIVKYISTIESAANYDILYVGEVSEPELDKLIKTLKNLPVLTISNSTGYSNKGIIINFYQSMDNLKFEINTQASISAGLIVSYRLLQKAKIINESKSE